VGKYRDEFVRRGAGGEGKDRGGDLEWRRPGPQLERPACGVQPADLVVDGGGRDLTGAEEAGRDPLRRNRCGRGPDLRTRHQSGVDLGPIDIALGVHTRDLEPPFRRGEPVHVAVVRFGDDGSPTGPADVVFSPVWSRPYMDRSARPVPTGIPRR